MSLLGKEELQRIYERSLSFLCGDDREKIVAALHANTGQRELPEILQQKAGEIDMPEFLPDLARLEAVFRNAFHQKIVLSEEITYPALNPTVYLLELSWKGLVSLLLHQEGDLPQPEKGRQFVLVWVHAGTEEVRMRPASDEDLLLLKMVVEEIKPEEIALMGNIPVDNIYAAMDRAAAEGILLSLPSLLRRNSAAFNRHGQALEQFMSPSIMTLQWHVTQSCDLHCKHCYDRSERSSMTLEDGIKILDDFQVFCRERRVRGQISFSGGNPLLYPKFTELYRAAVERGFVTAILGNPSTRQQIEELIAIQMPSFFQVSLEGLQEHNDNIRGKGHFERVIAFLSILRELKVYSMVMLTLTKDNVDQVIPLAAGLRDRTNTFNFNRLAMVGEGSNLRLPSKEQYEAFLKDYLKAADENPVMGIKDNLINILHQQQEVDFFGGCTGFGCGAAFNFLSILSDGEVHACRKFPSPIGNILKQGIAAVYDSAVAIRYREGSSACSECSIRPVCGGCLAVTHGHGLDVFIEKDPYCFINTKS
ncbi:MAG: thio(seleno)oxazole modification radical SAM maturase SbtM [Nitrospirota bacterium]|nr:thio(seleno)oxazole modification radical SAM maturase SbtM [Nitrospirota bacterium]